MAADMSSQNATRKTRGHALQAKASYSPKSMIAGDINVKSESISTSTPTSREKRKSTSPPSSRTRNGRTSTLEKTCVHVAYLYV